MTGPAKFNMQATMYVLLIAGFFYSDYSSQFKQAFKTNLQIVHTCRGARKQSSDRRGEAFDGHKKKRSITLHNFEIQHEINQVCQKYRAR